MFTIDEVLANPLYPEEIEKDVLEEAEKLGRVEKACGGGWVGLQTSEVSVPDALIDMTRGCP